MSPSRFAKLLIKSILSIRTIRTKAEDYTRNTHAQTLPEPRFGRGERRHLHGNSHMLMQDKNSDQLADLVIAGSTSMSTRKRVRDEGAPSPIAANACEEEGRPR
jgi:hypothetical protein